MAKAKKKAEPQPEPKAKEVSYEFDVDKFASAQFKDRTADVSVPDLKAFFPPGTKPAFKVRGLTALELARADQEVAINKEAQNESLLEKVGTEAMEALRKLLRTHLGQETPGQYVKSLHVVHMGLVKPKFTYDQVIKLADNYPVEFRTALIKINELTGRGRDFEKKPKGSGESQESSTQ